MRTLMYILAFVALVCCSCEYKLRPAADDDTIHRIEVKRYDRMQSQYLTTGDYAALQQMETDYPIETRTLIETVLKLGSVDDPEINSRLLAFYQDSTLQVLISDAEAAFANMDDVNHQLEVAFKWLMQAIPNLQVPLIYAQIGTLDYSIIVGDHSLGISLDKYLGEDYPLYAQHYNQAQRQQMSRDNIVPDCISFYLLSLYPMADFETRTQEERDIHIGKILWVTNKAVGKAFFKSPYIQRIDHYMRRHPATSAEALLQTVDVSELR